MFLDLKLTFLKLHCILFMVKHVLLEPRVIENIFHSKSLARIERQHPINEILEALRVEID
jgi:hypothetical protein